MPFISRIALSSPFALVLIEYLSYIFSVMANSSIDNYQQNHALRETIFAIIIAGVALNFIWSTEVTRGKLMLIACMGAPLIFGFWIATWTVGFGETQAYRAVYVTHIAQVVLFVVGYLMVSTRS